MDGFTVNGRSYRLPRMAVMLEGGWRGTARGALPSFTNVNNSAIVTGATPAVTGMSGNFFLDPDTGREVMMNSSDFLRCETILGAICEVANEMGLLDQSQ